MIAKLNNNPSRRELLVGFTLVGLFGSATHAAATGSRVEPSDLIPRHFSVDRFTTLSANEVYKVNLAARRGRRIIIAGYSASESRQIIKEAAANWPATRKKLQSSHN